MIQPQTPSAVRKVITLVALKLKSAFIDVLPIVLVVGFFQAAVLQQPLPDVADVIVGSLLVVIGLMFFVQGLEMGLFPIGESMAEALTRKGSLTWLLIFSFFLGFSTTVAEPALIAVAGEAARVAADGGLIEKAAEPQRAYALGLRIAVSISVGLAIVLGILRILKGWPIYYLIIGGYFLIMVTTYFAPEEIIGIAYDAGGVTTSTITVPLVTALGVGLASSIKGRSPLVDGFGLIAFASLTPMMFVMLYGMLVFR